MQETTRLKVASHSRFGGFDVLIERARRLRREPRIRDGTLRARNEHKDGKQARAGHYLDCPASAHYFDGLRGGWALFPAHDECSRHGGAYETPEFGAIHVGRRGTCSA